MKTEKFYVVALGMCGDCAEQIAIVKATSLGDLKNKGFKKTKDQDVYSHETIEEAESFCKKYASEYPKNRIKYWI